MEQNFTLDVTIHMMIGLPTSGKTYYVENELRKKDKTIIYAEFDRYIVYGEIPDYQKIWKNIYDSFFWSDLKYSNFAFDGLFLTDGIRITVLKSFIKHVKKVTAKYLAKDDYKFNIILHVWNEDRETCIENDEQRKGRANSSYNTIKYATYELPDVDAILEALNDEQSNVKVQIENHTVKKLSVYEKYFEPYVDCDKEDILSSDRWSNGGFWCDYTGASGEVEAEESVEFKEFEELLEKVCPNISFLQYKKLRDECVTIHEFSVDDYYGGTVRYSKWDCNLKKLYKLLKDNNLLEVD